MSKNLKLHASYSVIMSSGIASLHKILKDETRSKIILLLDEKGSISYTDLMETLGFLTTGLLNYHLKTLGDLVSKDESGQYILTEKGKLASRLLKEFPNGSFLNSGTKPRWWRRFWIEMAIFATFALAIVWAAYFSGYLDVNGVQRGIISIVSAVAFAYMFHHILRDVLSKKRQLMIAKVAWTGLGAWLGWVITFFGTVLISAIYRFYGESPPLANANGWWFLILSFVVAPIVGARFGYWFGKRRRFKTPNYNPDA